MEKGIFRRKIKIHHIYFWVTREKTPGAEAENKQRCNANPIIFLHFHGYSCHFSG
jgi:hypothetical protein